MNNFENKFYKIEVNKEELFIKTGKTSDDCNMALMNLEILDYCGKIELIQDRIYIDNKIISKISYIFLDQMMEINSNEFYDKLAYEIMKFIIRLNFKQTDEFEQLKFNATEERRALYRKLKVPLIIKETIL